MDLKRTRIAPSLHKGANVEDIPDVLKKVTIDTSCLFYDLDAFNSSLQALKNAFAPNWKHTIAVKANPLLKMLEIIVEKGFGLECASLFEVELSIKAKCKPENIMFDSPCKTIDELRRALELSVQINCDSFEEVERIQFLFEKEKIQTKSIIGIRINPLLGFGTIKALSVSDATSKFGISLTEANKKKILTLFKENSFLTGLHCHVGSQGCSLDMLATGAKTILELAKEIGNVIKVLDIGGGLPTNFISDETNPTFDEYSKCLKDMCPELFSINCPYTCITEFGRSFHAKLGWVASKCELIKESGLRRIAIIHVGSDMFVRTCYCPTQFPLRVQIFDQTQNFNLSERKLCEHNVVGPLCFGGDKICEGSMLPEIHQNDIVVIRDAGANCLSLWSRHCSRPSPAVYGYSRNKTSNDIELLLIRKPENLQQVLQFWE